MSDSGLRHIAVDLMPMLPGGRNGGARPFILQLLNALAQTHPTVQFTCLSPADVEPTLQAELAHTNVRIQPLAARRRWLWRPPQGAQLLFCPFGPASLPSHGRPVLSIFYDLQVLAHPDFFTARERGQRRQHLHQLRRHSRRIAAISHFSRQEGIRHGLDPERIRAIPIQMASPRPCPAITPPLELTRGRYLLYPANLWPHKNHELLFTAFAMARAQGLPSDLRLVCSGDGNQRRDVLQQLATGLGLEGQVLLPGYVSHATLESLYHHANAVVFPSLYEGFGMPVIEAMARRIPVCCSNGTALAEVGGDAVLGVDPRHPQQIATALLTLTVDADLRRSLTGRGVQQASHYLNPAAMAMAYWTLLEETHRQGPM